MPNEDFDAGRKLGCLEHKIRDLRISIILNNDPWGNEINQFSLQESLKEYLDLAYRYDLPESDIRKIIGNNSCTIH